MANCFPQKYLENAQSCSVSSPGEQNPDKYFLVIRQEGTGRGLFSLLSSILCWLNFADRHGFIPVIDLKNFKTVYNEDSPVNENENSFNYYFELNNGYSLESVYASKNVIFTLNGYPKGYSYSITNVPDLIQTWKKHIQIKPYIARLVDNVERNFTGKTVGIHFRGQEMRTAAGHWFPPTKKQMFHAIDRMVDRCGFEKMYVVTEDQRLLESIISKYGSSVHYSDHYRTTGSNAYSQYPRQNHKYLLGLEVLVDMLVLSRCQGLVHCTSNVAEMAKFLNEEQYCCSIKINNGPNSRFWPLAKFLWYLRNSLPAFAGGFSTSDDVILFSERQNCELKITGNLES
jgi:hypothetical protein